MFENVTSEFISILLYEPPEAYAQMQGAPGGFPVKGKVYFYKADNGTLVLTMIEGLPQTNVQCDRSFFGFHIHEGGSCTGNAQDSFADAKAHYNPANAEHPCHAGDMPVLLGNKGFAWMLFYTDGYMPEEVLGRTVIIHDMPDDFRSQPSGDSGMKIACGVIEVYALTS